MTAAAKRALDNELRRLNPGGKPGDRPEPVPGPGSASSPSRSDADKEFYDSLGGDP